VPMTEKARQPNLLPMMLQHDELTAAGETEMLMTVNVQHGVQDRRMVTFTTYN